MLTFKENIAIDEKVKRILEKAGWYPGRRENIDEVINYFKKYGIALSEKAKDFISEYYKIMPYWFFNTDKTDRGGDFEFMFFPYPSSYKINVFDYLYDDLDGALKSEEYKAVVTNALRDHRVNVSQIFSRLRYRTRVSEYTKALLSCLPEEKK